ncbi:hypothetical protein [Streptomyces vilmorinianum]|uniref:hypothetical protein n=1 Tax=Streptomyces vilmorinianum TaxID=3051092 RepID=UPI0010FB2FBD|nr:hypothetical protein [Streptomyces vilmorinianum]
MLLPPENTLFVPGDAPALLLAGAPVHEELPALHAPGGAVPPCAGWSVVPQLTVCVVDGPGDAGCLVPAFVAPVFGGSGTPDDMAGWCEDVVRAGGAVVVSLPELPRTLDWELLLTGGVARGGFVPVAG